MEKLAASGISYGVVDALSDRHLATIGAAIAIHALVTGGSGVALGLPGEFSPRGSARRGGRAVPAAGEGEGGRARRKLLDRDARADRACARNSGRA